MRLILLVFLIYFIAGSFFLVQAQESSSDQDQKKDEKPPGTGQVQGVVKDALGKPLAGVALRLQSADGEVVSKTQSEKDGLFTFTGVAPGTYAVVGEKPEFQSATAIVTLAGGATEKTTLTLKANKALEMEVIEKRLERARNGLLPETGSSIYRFDQKDITTLPQGFQTPMNQVLLQTPGVVQDSFGQLHVRGEHANLQYRLNGIILPESITGFGQVLDTRFVDRINFLTGALPAQYGYRTAGVVDIHTKEGAFVNGGRVDLYGGSHSDIEPSVEYGGSKGAFNYYITASYVQNDFGIESPTPALNPIHDHTQQGKAFGYFSYLLNSTSRLSLILGDAESTFEIPNNPGQQQQFSLTNVCTVPVPPGPCTVNSTNLNENQREANRYGILALQGTAGSQFDYQIAFFSRYSEVLFEPDYNGDLVFNGVASRVEESSFSNGLQGDSSYRLNESHTVRTGLFVSGERAISENTSGVFSTDMSTPGCTTNPCQTPENIVDNNGITAWLYGVYLQDEWRPTDKLTVNYGVRADLVDAYVHANQVSPRLGAVYQATPQMTLHAGYARYFTPPPTELVAPKDLALFQNTTNAAPLNSLDSNVLPERSHYFDVGVTHQLTPSLSLGLDGYYKIVHNLLDEGQFGQALVFTPFNYKDGKIYGLEFTGNFKKNNFSSYLNTAYSKAQGRDIVSAQFNIDPVELAYIANHYIYLDHNQALTSSAGASYLWAGTNYSVDAIYGSGLRAGFANTQTVRDNFQVNLGITHSVVVPHLGKLEARLTALNIFDRVNELRSGTGVGVGAPQYATRRAFYGGVNLAF